jgi:hypothetical protein
MVGRGYRLVGESGFSVSKIKKGNYAYNEAGVLTLRQQLDSMQSSEETAVPAATSDDIWQEVPQGC